MFIKLIFLTLFVFSYSLNASEVTVIELHKNKSLDQLVLENENLVTQENQQDKIDLNTENAVVEASNDSIEINNENNEDVSNNVLDEADNNSNESKNSEEVTLITTESIFEVNDNIIKNHLASISKIQSQILNKEFLNVLANSNLQDQ